MYHLKFTDTGLIYLSAYIGGTDAETDGTWKWDDGEPFNYDNWDVNEPNGGLDENCIELRPSGKWNDMRCGQETNFDFICETPIRE